MPKKTSVTGSELFIVDNSEEDWKAVRYLHDWCQLSKSIDIATGYFEIGALLALDGEWQKVDGIRLLMGDEVSKRTEKAFEEGQRKSGTSILAATKSARSGSRTARAARSAMTTSPTTRRSSSPCRKPSA